MSAQATTEQRPVLSVEETAEILGIHHTTLRADIAAGRFPVIRVGRRILVSRAVLEKMLNPPAKDGTNG